MISAMAKHGANRAHRNAFRSGPHPPGQDKEEGGWRHVNGRKRGTLRGKQGLPSSQLALTACETQVYVCDHDSGVGEVEIFEFHEDDTTGVAV